MALLSKLLRRMYTSHSLGPTSVHKKPIGDWAKLSKVITAL